MSTHCCNKFCELDDRFHQKQKDLLDYNGDMSEKDSYDFLVDHFSDDKELLAILQKHEKKSGVCPNCWYPLTK